MVDAKAAKPPLTLKEFTRLYEEHDTLRAVANAAEYTYGAVWGVYQKALAGGLVQKKPRRTKEYYKRRSAWKGRVKSLQAVGFELPPKGKTRRYLCTSAQNNTKLHEPLWVNMLALAARYDARLMVSRFAYIKSGLGASGDKASLFARVSGYLYENVRSLWWDKRLEPYLADTREDLAPGLVWCEEMNILPTAVRPLSELEAYTGRKSGIFPHVKLALDSVPSGKHEATKFNYTTGTVTLRNYIQKKAGLKAEFHHCYGGLLVEVDSDGNWWVRQINADSTGTIYDLDLCVRDGRVTAGHRAEAITWGDIHVSQIDPMVDRLAWDRGGMLDVLRPRHQFLHDVFSFYSRNRHDRNNPHKIFERHVTGNDDVAMELKECGAWIAGRAARPWCKTMVVESNHDNMLERWLRYDPGWYTRDPGNAEVFLDLQLAKYRSIKRKDWQFLMIEHALWNYSPLKKSDAQFLREDESFVICPDRNGGIECGMHGHLGPNGGRGYLRAFAKMGRKAITGHTHVAGIVDGIYSGGTSSLLDMEYNTGPSSWSHSHVVTYANGKRAIITMWEGKWRA